ncbi:MAG: cytochrome c biogenesis protein CcsA [Firmicutes bacterium]|nr:cytochrome c biogenesis protein CcsA [Bacillota bacterium]
MMIGNLMLLGGFIASGLAVVAYALAMRGDQKMLILGRRAFYTLAGLATAAGIYLMYLILTHRFQVAYVFQYSDSRLPAIYLFSSFWAGQEGTFLLWAVFGGWLGIWLLKREKNFEAHLMPFMALMQAFLFVILLKKSPFALMPPEQLPVEGAGLNPLLQNFWMGIHPPVVFLGYAGLTIPFAFAMAALLRREYDTWVKRALPWTLFAWLTLGAGIFIGGYWAYNVLGWGGYWGWDPVENASLIPWLVSTALLHGMLLQRTRGTIRKTNIIFATLTFLLILYGTFLTRSGVLSDFSVHSFADLGITAYLVGFLTLFFLLAAVLYVMRAREIAGEPAYEKVVSREFAFVATLGVLAAAAIVILAGTSAPLLTRISGNPGSVSTSFYNVTNTPVGILLALLLGLCPVLAWKQDGRQATLSRLVAPVAVAVIGAVVAAILGVRTPIYLFFVASAIFGVTTNLIMFVSVLRGKIINTGGYLTHIGVGLMLAGIVASSAYSQTVKLNLAANEPQSAFGYRFTYRGMFVPPATGKPAVKLEVARNGRSFVVAPEMYYSQYNDGMMRTPSIKKLAFEDLYISPVEKPEAGQSDVVRFDIAKRETREVAGYRFYFDKFDMSQHNTGSNVEQVGVVLRVTYQGKETTLTPSVDFSGSEPGFFPAQLPGHNAQVEIDRISASEGIVGLALKGIAPDGREVPPPVDRMVIEVSVKPLINVLWLGTLLVLIGGAVAWRRRDIELNKQASESRAGELPA